MVTFLALMCAGTFCLGAENILKKKLLHTGMHEQILLGVSWFLGGLFLLPLLLITGVPEVQDGFWYALVATVALNLVGQNLFIRAFALSDVSLVSPIRLIIPPVVMLTGYLFLQETLSLVGILGVLTTVVGLAFVLGAGERGFSISKILSHVRDPGVRFAFLASLIFAVAFPFDKLAVLNSSGLFASTVIALVLGASILLTASLWQRNFIPAIRGGHSLSALSILFAISALLGLGTFLTNQALLYAPVAYASSAKRFQVVWTNILAGAFLKEQHAGERLVGVLVMLLGILLMVVFQ